MARYQRSRPCRPTRSTPFNLSSDDSDDEVAPTFALTVPQIRIGDLVTAVMVDTGSPINLVSPSMATHEGFLKGSFMGPCSKTVILPTGTLYFDMKFTSRVTMAHGGKCISAEFHLSPHPLKANILLGARTIAAINSLASVATPTGLQPCMADMERHLLKFGSHTVGALGHTASPVSFVSGQFALTFDFLRFATPLQCTTALDFMGEAFDFYSTKFLVTFPDADPRKRVKIEFYVARFDMPERMFLGRAALLALQDPSSFGGRLGGPTRHLQQSEFDRDDKDNLIIKVPRFIRHVLA